MKGLTMLDLDEFPITRRWPPTRPDVIQLYSLPTPNGVKISILLEETGLPYEVHRVDFARHDQITPEFLSLSPNNKIPAILDPNGPDGAPLALFESGAILTWLGDKTGQFLPRDGAARYRVLQWLFFQVGGVGPMFGQLGWFHKFDGAVIEDKRPHERYRAEAARLLGVLEGELARNAARGEDWIAGAYSVADIALAPWVRTLRDYYGAGEITGLAERPHVLRWLDAFLARPAVQRGMLIPAA
jgi:GST-like protein